MQNKNVTNMADGEVSVTGNFMVNTLTSQNITPIIIHLQKCLGKENSTALIDVIAALEAKGKIFFLFNIRNSKFKYLKEL